MKTNKITRFMAAAALTASMALTGCTSYEIDMPENPAEPVVGNEVSTNTIYQANPRFFGNNDCLNAVKAQLPRIASMDCDILWVMPICKPGEVKAFGSPYCISDFKAVNARYGSVADFKSLVDAAHEKGMKVMLDWIANHTAWDCPWITEDPDMYKKDANGDIVSPSGWDDVAQLDYSSRATRDAMIDAMLYWVKECGIDGYRCDYADGVPGDFWEEVIAELHKLNPDFIMLAETSKTEFYGYGFDMIYDWNSATTISSAFTGGKATDIVKEAVDALSKVPDGKSILRYVLNHDVAAENDVARMFGSADALPAAYVCASMLNGTPMIYSAMDVEGISGKMSFFDYKTLTFSEALSGKYAAINKAFKKSAEIRRGELQDYSTSTAVCFVRAIPGHNLVVAVNPSSKAQSVRMPIYFAGQTMEDAIEGTSVTVPSYVELAPYSYVIYMD